MKDSPESTNTSKGFMVKYCHKESDFTTMNTQIVLTKEESADVLAFKAGCEARAEGYAAGMRDAVQEYLRRVVEAKKQEGKDGSSTDQAGAESPAA
jgi:hypothetical protein